jgi:hypothetical protein
MLKKIEHSLNHIGLKKVIILSILFFMGIGIEASETANPGKMPMITHIGLQKNQFHNTHESPKVLILEITITNKAFYKIFSNIKTISAGMIDKGLNRVGIDAAELFNAPGTHVYILETKFDRWNFRYEITLDIQLDTPVPDSHPVPVPSTPGIEGPVKPGEFPQTNVPIGYDLAMYIKGRLVAKTRKLAPRRVIDRTNRKIREALEAGKKERPRDNDPKNPAAIHIPSMNMNVTGPLVPLVKLFLKKKGPLPPNNRQLALSFWKKEKSGTLKKIEAVIRLQSRIIPHGMGDL